MEFYRMEAKRAADELKVMKTRLIGARDLKAKSGRYGGEVLPPGYVLDERKDLPDDSPNPEFHTYVVYEPHSQVVRIIFDRLALPGQTPTKVARHLRERGIVFPPFTKELATKANLKGFSQSRRTADGGWPATVGRVRNVGTNPSYIGWKVWGGEVVNKSVYPPIVDEQTFWTVQERFGSHDRPKEYDPLPLAGLVYCGNHDAPQQMGYANRSHPRKSCYRCLDRSYGEYCCQIAAYILDGPISEAIFGQLAQCDNADEVLEELTSEYKKAKVRAASYRREMKRMEAEVENMRTNLLAGVLILTS
jgi:hypothetical protein